MKTIPVGRFLIDVPENSEISWGRQHFNYAGPFLHRLPADEPRDVKKLAEKEAEKHKAPKEQGSKVFKSLIEGKTPNSWFVFYYSDALFKGDYVDIDCYFWREGKGYQFHNRSHDTEEEMAARILLLEGALQTLKSRLPGESPAGAGFCIEDAYFKGEPEEDPTEHVSIRVNLPTHPDVHIRFSTDTIGEEEDTLQNLLERHDDVPPGYVRPPSIRDLRAANRQVGPWLGQELLQRIVEPRLKVGYNFTWEYMGRPLSARSPSITLELITGHRETPVTSSLSRKETMALWDRILNSIRFREPQPPGHSGSTSHPRS